MQTISEWHYLPAAKMCMSVTIWLIRIYQSHLTSVSLENFKKSVVPMSIHSKVVEVYQKLKSTTKWT